MRAIPFSDGYLKTIQEWLKFRDLPDTLTSELPKIGFLIFKEDAPICCAFLRICEGGLGIFEGLCTNPKMAPQVRNDAIEFATKVIFEEAKKSNIHRILAYSVDTSTIERGKNHGFVALPHTMLLHERCFNGLFKQSDRGHE